MRVVAVMLAALSVAAAARAEILVTTEEYPPFNMTVGDKVGGMATDVVRAIFARAAVPYRIELLPWQRAYGMALAQPDTCVYSTTVTDERRPLFEWVGPLITNNWVLFARADFTGTVKRLEDVKGRKIGGYLGDATAQFLQGQGYDVDVAPTDALNAVKLVNGRLDFWATGSAQGPFLAMQQGITTIKPVLAFKDVVLSLACNKATDPAILERLRTALPLVRPEP